MTVIFEHIHSETLISHSDVIHIQTEDSCLGCHGFGLHFADNTYCLVSTDSYKLISVAQQNT